MKSGHHQRNPRYYFIGLIILLGAALIGGWLLSPRPEANPPSPTSPTRAKSAGINHRPAPVAGTRDVMAPVGKRLAETSRAAPPQPVAEPEYAEPEPVPPEIARAFPSITGAVDDWREFRPDNLTVEPWPGERITFTRTAVKEEGRYVTWIGRNPDLPGASLVGVSTATGYDAIMVLPGANQVSYHVRGEKVVTTESTPGAEGCGNAPVQAPKTPAESFAFVYDVTHAQGHEPVSDDRTTRAETAPLNVAVLVTYDADTLAAATTKSSDPIGYIDGQCKALVETSNLALGQSLVTAFVWRYLGAVAAPVYTRTGKSLDDIGAMRPSGVLGDWLKSTRYKRGADQIVLMIGGEIDFGGRASNPKQTAVGRDSANAVVKWGLSYSVIAHELAHNFGCQHDRAHITVNAIGDYGPPAPDNDGFYCYGQLWDNPPPPPGFASGTTGDIMSYADWIIPYFSNPNITLHITGAMVGRAASLELGTQQIGRPETDPKAAYNARVLNDNAKAMSDISEEITAITIGQQPRSVSVSSGSTVLLEVRATGGGLTYQWMKDGVAISGATAASYSRLAEETAAGSYTVVVSNLTGSLTSSAATITVTTPPPPVAVPVSSGGGGGGGGGAVSPWLCGALGLLCLMRRLLRRLG